MIPLWHQGPLQRPTQGGACKTEEQNKGDGGFWGDQGADAVAPEVAKGDKPKPKDVAKPERQPVPAREHK